MQTWKDFKTAIEAAGVRDEDEVAFIDCDHAPIVTFETFETLKTSEPSEPEPDLQPGEPRVSREPREPRAFHVS